MTIETKIKSHPKRVVDFESNLESIRSVLSPKIISK